MFLQESYHPSKLIGEITYSSFILKIGRFSTKHRNIAPPFVAHHCLVKYRRRIAGVKQAGHFCGGLRKAGLYVVQRQPAGGAPIRPQSHSLAGINILQQVGGGSSQKGGLHNHVPGKIHSRIYLRSSTKVTCYERLAFLSTAYYL